MEKAKRHIYTSDVIAIFLNLGMTIYSIFIYKEYCLPFVFYFFTTLAFRVVILLMQRAIVKKYDDPLVKFKKERFISRIAGILLLVVDLSFAGMIFFGTFLKSYEIYEKFPWLLAVYGVYALYKLIAGIGGFKKSRKSFSPFRDVMTALHYIDSLVSFMTLLGFVLQLYFGLMNNDITMTVFMYIIVFMVILSLVITGKLIFSRKVPNLLRQSWLWFT